jgi:uncharacterized membrane protein YraQ (UPF0718 family)
MENDLRSAVKKTARALWSMVPVLAGVVLLIGLANAVIPKSAYSSVFTGGIADPVIGGALGSVLAGNPVTSYVLAGEFLKQGVSLIAVTAFLVAWVTVGIVQLPAESIILGRKFALTRNILSFVFSILVAVTTVFVMGLI